MTMTHVLLQVESHLLSEKPTKLMCTQSPPVVEEQTAEQVMWSLDC